MANRRRKHVDYNKISNENVQGEALPEMAVLNNEHKYTTLVGNLNVRKGPGKDFPTADARDICPEGSDGYGRLKEGADILVADTITDTVGNVWGKLASQPGIFVCIFDKERETYFAAKGE